MMRCLIVYVRVSIFKSLYKLCEWYPFFWDMTPHNWVIFSLKLKGQLTGLIFKGQNFQRILFDSWKRKYHIIMQC